MMTKPINDYITDQIKKTGSINFDLLFDDIGNRSLNEDDSEKILMWASSFERMDVFLKIKDRINDPRSYWRILRSAYQESDNLYRWKNEIKKCFKSDRPGINQLMNDDERKTFESLQDDLLIHRGMTVSEKQSENFGISWTLDKTVAEYFAYTYGRNIETANNEKTVVSLTVKKKNLIAFFDGRNEKEIIFIPG